MSKIVWDETGKRIYETGVKMGVLYTGLMNNGVAWNGLSAVTESPSGAEPSPIYADDIKYLNLISAEEFGATIEAYTYPDEFSMCDGSLELDKGVMIGQQDRKKFGLSYRTSVGNDVDGTDYGYKIHLIYGASASPSDKAYATINDSPEAITFSWTVTTTPVSVEGFKPTAALTIDSTKVDQAKLKLLEDILYGTTSTAPRLPAPNEVASIFKSAVPGVTTVTTVPADNATAVIVNASAGLTFTNNIISEQAFIATAVGKVVDTTNTINGKVLSLKPKAPLSAATKYMIVMASVVDEYGRSVPTSITMFTTA